MRFTPMAVLIGFLSTAVTAGPFDGFLGGAENVTRHGNREFQFLITSWLV